MAITYNSVDIRGVAAEPIFEEIFYDNETISQSLVRIEEDIKAETIFTEATADITLQPYTCGKPTEAGDVTMFDTVVTPVKFLFFAKFCPDNLRFSRFKRDMKPGAWNVMSSEFEQLMMQMYGGEISEQMQNLFWSNVTSATKTAVAALTAGTAQNQVSTAEKALVAATPTGTTNAAWDGIVQRMIYNSSNQTQTAGVGGRIKVAGTTISTSNIKAEYDKLYAAIPSRILKGKKRTPVIYAPYSHMQMINIYNNDPAQFKTAFSVTGEKYYFNGIEIVFVPLPENVMIAAPKEHLVWATDLASDYNRVEIKQYSDGSDEWWIKVVATLTTHVVGQRFNVLYVG